MKLIKTNLKINYKKYNLFLNSNKLCLNSFKCYDNLYVIKFHLTMKGSIFNIQIVLYIYSFFKKYHFH